MQKNEWFLLLNNQLYNFNMTRKQYQADNVQEEKVVDVFIEKQRQKGFEDKIKRDLRKESTFTADNFDQLYDMFTEVIVNSTLLEYCRFADFCKFVENSKLYKQGVEYYEERSWYYENSGEIKMCFGTLENRYEIFSRRNCTFNRWITFCYLFTGH